MTERRENFGPGTAGKLAFELISSGLAKCPVRIEINGGAEKPCGDKATQTVDFNVPGIAEVEFVTVCPSEDHRQIAEIEIINSSSGEKKVNPGSFGKNGFGRP